MGWYITYDIKVVMKQQVVSIKEAKRLITEEIPHYTILPEDGANRDEINISHSEKYGSYSQEYMKILSKELGELIGWENIKSINIEVGGDIGYGMMQNGDHDENPQLSYLQIVDL